MLDSDDATLAAHANARIDQTHKAMADTEDAFDKADMRWSVMTAHEYGSRGVRVMMVASHWMFPADFEFVHTLG